MQQGGKYIGYIRVSTKHQAESGLGLDAQRAKIELYAQLMDMELVDIVVDAGVSGRKLDRPGLQEALQRMTDGEADGLIIAKLDRLSRSVGHTAHLIGKYFSSGEKHLQSVTDSLNTTTANGRMVINILSTMAQWEAEVISERTKDGLAALEGKENVKLGPDHYGMTRHEEELVDGRRKILSCSEEQKNIKLMIELREDGKGFRAICRELEARGIKTKKGKTKWHHSTVQQILEAQGA